MAMAVCISSGSFLSPPPRIRRRSPPPAAAPLPILSSLTLTPRPPKWLHSLFLDALACTLSLTLSPSPPATSAGSPPRQEQLLPMGAPSGSVTNQEIVKEGWLVIEDSFFDARLGHRFPDKWQELREIVLDRNIITRSKARDLIRRMLATLDDHCTRFLTPSEFAKMAKYDVTGIVDQFNPIKFRDK